MSNASLAQHIADLIGADPKDIVFTSGATESNNMAVKGVARFHKEKKNHIITTQTVNLFFYLQSQILTFIKRNTNASSTLVGSLVRRVSK